MSVDDSPDEGKKEVKNNFAAPSCDKSLSSLKRNPHLAKFVETAERTSTGIDRGDIGQKLLYQCQTGFFDLPED